MSSSLDDDKHIKSAESDPPPDQEETSNPPAPSSHGALSPSLPRPPLVSTGPLEALLDRLEEKIDKVDDSQKRVEERLTLVKQEGRQIEG